LLDAGVQHIDKQTDRLGRLQKMLIVRQNNQVDEEARKYIQEVTELLQYANAQETRNPDLYTKCLSILHDITGYDFSEAVSKKFARIYGQVMCAKLISEHIEQLDTPDTNPQSKRIAYVHISNLMQRYYRIKWLEALYLRSGKEIEEQYGNDIQHFEERARNLLTTLQAIQREQETSDGSREQVHKSYIQVMADARMLRENYTQLMFDAGTLRSNYVFLPNWQQTVDADIQPVLAKLDQAFKALDADLEQQTLDAPSMQYTAHDSQHYQEAMQAMEQYDLKKAVSAIQEGGNTYDRLIPRIIQYAARGRTERGIQPGEILENIFNLLLMSNDDYLKTYSHNSTLRFTDETIQKLRNLSAQQLVSPKTVQEMELTRRTIQKALRVLQILDNRGFVEARQLAQTLKTLNDLCLVLKELPDDSTNVQLMQRAQTILQQIDERRGLRKLSEQIDLLTNKLVW
jgi:hypothetical protein